MIWTLLIITFTYVILSQSIAIFEYSDKELVRNETGFDEIPYHFER